MTEHILPCGDSLIVKTDPQSGERSYYLDGWCIWVPKNVHRVALQQAILIEDAHRYQEKENKP